MQSEKFDDLRSHISLELKEKFKLMQEHAEHYAYEKVQSLIDEEKAFELTEDEERMLKAYRNFLSKSKPGSTFSWRTSKIKISQT